MKRNGYEVVPLDRSHLDAAVALVHRAYQAERRTSPLLPAKLLGDPRRVRPHVEACLPNGCVGAFRGPRLAGFMGVSFYFPFKGHTAALVREVSHAAAGDDKLAVYQALYEGLGPTLAARQAQLHLVGHFAGDRALRDALFQLGFGAILAEALRDLSPIEGAAGVPITHEPDFSVVEALDAEHRRYYRQAPIFLVKDASTAAVRSGLAEQQQAGHALFVHRHDGRPAAYFVAGRCLGEEEGFLLQGSNTAEVLAAYAQPAIRGRDIGKALLDRCVAWAREQGYARLFVEHETANVLGGNFWRKHFRPYLYFSMRYVEAAWR
jgi:GNAT superfamily N-acetyltransferase